MTDRPMFILTAKAILGTLSANLGALPAEPSNF